MFEWLKNLFGRGGEETWRADESQMSPQERKFVEQSPEERGAERFVEEHLGGEDHLI
jgi:hypothetical protein